MKNFIIAANPTTGASSGQGDPAMPRKAAERLRLKRRPSQRLRRRRD
jgi:hypothetical protein